MCGVLTIICIMSDNFDIDSIPIGSKRYAKSAHLRHISDCLF